MRNYISVIVLVSILFVITGSITISTSKLIIDKINKSYCLVATFIYFGEFICLYIFQLLRCNKLFRKTHKKQLHSKVNKYIFILPVMLDGISIIFTLLALRNLDVVVYAMLRTFSLIITAILSMKILKSKFYRHHYIGMLLIIGGGSLLGFISNQSILASANNISGYIFLLISYIFYACENVIQQMILSKYDINSLEVVGLEGMYGFTIMMFILPVYYYATTQDLSTIPSIIKLIFTNAESFRTVGMFIVSVCLYKILNIYLVKTTSASTIATLDPFKVILISIFNETSIVHFLPLLGLYCMIILGAFIFHEVIEIPIWSMNAKTMTNLLKVQRAIKDPNYDLYEGSYYLYGIHETIEE